LKMNDTIITAERKKREFTFIIISFIAAFLFNLYSIIRYGHPFKEILTQLHVVLIVTIVFYFILVLLRMIWWLFTFVYVRFIK
jgi:phosphotransferase system  glucose/maltose/N-acetylglucosamine-specific IIC component